MQSFKAYRDEKANQHVLPDSAKGVICEKSGSAPKSYCCYNRHGVRCSPDFQAEWDTCPGAGCQVETKLGECPYPLPDHAVECENHYDDDEWYRMLHSCKTNGDMQESLCPQPCGCVLEGQPKRESSSAMKTQIILGSCGSTGVTDRMRKVLNSWNVPGDFFIKYEMAALFDAAQFVVFDLFIQPKKNEARYKLALGAARCHGNHMEIGYMDTGMWKVDTLNDYKCHWKGGCDKVGIPEESIERKPVLCWSTTRGRTCMLEVDVCRRPGTRWMIHGVFQKAPKMEEMAYVIYTRIWI